MLKTGELNFLLEVFVRSSEYCLIPGQSSTTFSSSRFYKNKRIEYLKLAAYLKLLLKTYAICVVFALPVNKEVSVGLQ